MSKRMMIAVFSLGGIFLATYLTLYKLGYIEALACGTGSCEVVQSSRWSRLLGQPVAFYGVGFYIAMFVVSAAGSFGALLGSKRVSLLLVALSAGGLLFSGYLTYIEIWVLHAICRWCVGSAFIVVVLFGLSCSDMAEQRRPASD